jgi:ABC-type multidrug transport system fused ATPase/permease subunit
MKEKQTVFFDREVTLRMGEQNEGTASITVIDNTTNGMWMPYGYNESLQSVTLYSDNMSEMLNFFSTIKHKNKSKYMGFMEWLTDKLRTAAYYVWGGFSRIRAMNSTGVMYLIVMFFILLLITFYVWYLLFPLFIALWIIRHFHNKSIKKEMESLYLAVLELTGADVAPEPEKEAAAAADLS